MARHRPKKLLLTLDAFGTIFAPRKPIATQYMDVARRLGFPSIHEALIEKSFAIEFQKHLRRHPNYGKASGMEAPEWWADVIRSTFRPFTSKSNPLPSGLIPELLTRFSSSEAYRLYRDVSPFFEMIRKSRQSSGSQTNGDWPWEQTIIGVVTNSDDRVPSILSSLGLTVGPNRVNRPWKMASGPLLGEDISFVVLSYDVGARKSGRSGSRIFEAAKDMLALTIADGYIHEGKRPSAPQISAQVEDFVCLHVGDHVWQDVVGCQDAGFHGILLDRKDRHADAFQLSAKKIVSVTVKSVLPGEPSTPHQIQVIRDLRDLQYWTGEE